MISKVDLRDFSEINASLFGTSASHAARLAHFFTVPDAPERRTPGCGARPGDSAERHGNR